MSDPIRVLHRVRTWLPRTQTWLYEQLRHLPRERIRSAVAAERPEGDRTAFPWPELYLLFQDSPLRWALEHLTFAVGLRPYWPFVVEQAKRLRAQLLHGHFGDVAWEDHRAAAALGLPLVVSFYGRDVGWLPRRDARWYARYRALFAQAALVLCEGPHMAARIAELGCPPRKIRVHHLGVSLERLPFAPRRWHPGQPLRVLIAASFREKKGIPYALEALGLLQREVPLEITLVGGADGSWRSQRERLRIERVIRRYGLGRIMRRPGFLSHRALLEEAYRHHVFLAPSVTAHDGDSEGGAPVVLIEMAATGMPVVSTWHADIPEVIVARETGLLAPERDPEALAEQIRWLLRHPERWEAIARAARARIEAEFNAIKQGRRLAELYVSLAQAGSV
ncbi:MAG: glycosyltransferase [Bacteroidetes bacterium]|nr:glycosyltransferase [Bacteroidota bacterium]